MTSLPNTQGARRERNIRHVLFEILETIVLTAIIFFVIQAFIAQPFEVRQESMEATLEPGQLVLVDKLTPRWDVYKRFDYLHVAGREHLPTTREAGSVTRKQAGSDRVVMRRRTGRGARP